MVFYILILLIVFIISIILYYYFTGVFNYRLGDMIHNKDYNKHYISKLFYKIYYKDSIATEYLKKTEELRDYDTLYEILKKRIDSSQKPDVNTLVIHLRLGDAIEICFKDSVDELLNGQKNSEYIKGYNYFEENLNKIKDKNINKIILVSSSHRTIKRKKTNEYIEKIKKFLISFDYEVELRINNHSADEDFLFMSNSHYFLKAGGGFSNSINEMVLRNKKISLTEI